MTTRKIQGINRMIIENKTFRGNQVTNDILANNARTIKRPSKEKIMSHLEDMDFTQLDIRKIEIALINDLTKSEFKVWLYLLSRVPFPDTTKSGDRIFRDIPSPEEVSHALGMNPQTVRKCFNRLSKLDLFRLRSQTIVTRNQCGVATFATWQGFNETALGVKEYLRQKKLKGEAPQDSPMPKSDDRLNNNGMVLNSNPPFLNKNEGVLNKNDSIAETTEYQGFSDVYHTNIHTDPHTLSYQEGESEKKTEKNDLERIYQRSGNSESLESESFSSRIAIQEKQKSKAIGKGSSSAGAKKLPEFTEEQQRFFSQLIEYGKNSPKVAEPVAWARAVVVSMIETGTEQQDVFWQEFKNGLPLGSTQAREWEKQPGEIYQKFYDWLTQKNMPSDQSRAEAIRRVDRLISNPHSGFTLAQLWEEWKHSSQCEAERVERDRKLGITPNLSPEWRDRPSVSKEEAANNCLRIQSVISPSDKVALPASEVKDTDSLTSVDENLLSKIDNGLYTQKAIAEFQKIESAEELVSKAQQVYNSKGYSCKADAMIPLIRGFEELGLQISDDGIVTAVNSRTEIPESKLTEFLLSEDLEGAIAIGEAIESQGINVLLKMVNSVNPCRIGEKVWNQFLSFFGFEDCNGQIAIAF